MSPVVAEICACLPHVAPAISAGPESDWIRRAGVVVALAGACEAAPAGTAAVLAAVSTRVRRWARAAWAVFRRQPPKPPVEITAAGGVTLKMHTVLATGETWDESAPLQEQTAALHAWMQQLAARIANLERAAVAQTEALRAELQGELAQVRAAHEALAGRIARMEDSNTRIDARGVPVVAFGILLTGISAELAAWPPLGWASTAAGIIAAVEVGRRVVRDRRGRTA